MYQGALLDCHFMEALDSTFPHTLQRTGWLSSMSFKNDLVSCRVWQRRHRKFIMMSFFLSRNDYTLSARFVKVTGQGD